MHTSSLTRPEKLPVVWHIAGTLQQELEDLKAVTEQEAAAMKDESSSLKGQLDAALADHTAQMAAADSAKETNKLRSSWIWPKRKTHPCISWRRGLSLLVVLQWYALLQMTPHDDSLLLIVFLLSASAQCHAPTVSPALSVLGFPFSFCFVIPVVPFLSPLPVASLDCPAGFGLPCFCVP